MCTACAAYREALLPVCNICGKPVTVASKPKSRLREMGKPKAKHVRPFTAKQIAAMDNDMLQAILLDGRLYASLDFGNGYQDAVRRLVNAGYPVASYLWRVVSGKDT